MKQIDLEIDLLTSSKERDHVNGSITIISVIWVLFLLVSPMYLLKQIATINDPINDCSPTFAKTLYYVVVGSSLPISYVVNWIRFIVYKNWLLNSGIVTYDTEEARYGHGCLTTQASKDDALDDNENQFRKDE